MTEKNKSEDDGRVIPLRPRREPKTDAGAPVEDLGKYERTKEADDYRHRMLVNIAAVAVIALLGIAGIWLANKIADMRQNQDCVLSGRRNCAHLDVIPAR